MTRTGREKICDEKVVTAYGKCAQKIAVNDNKPSVIWRIIFMYIYLVNS